MCYRRGQSGATTISILLVEHYLHDLVLEMTGKECSGDVTAKTLLFHQNIRTTGKLNQQNGIIQGTLNLLPLKTKYVSD